MKVSVYIAVSLDGFIARQDGSLDWLDEASASVPEDEDLGFQAFMDTVDTLVMGRKTFEKVVSFGQWPYGDTPVMVLSHKTIDIPSTLPASVVHAADKPQVLLQQLSNQGVEHVYVDGGATIQGFLGAGLVDEICLTIVPVLIGKGIALFGELHQDVSLELVDTRAYPGGFVQLRYRPGRNSPPASH